MIFIYFLVYFDKKVHKKLKKKLSKQKNFKPWILLNQTRTEKQNNARGSFETYDLFFLALNKNNKDGHSNQYFSRRSLASSACVFSMDDRSVRCVAKDLGLSAQNRHERRRQVTFIYTSHISICLTLKWSRGVPVDPKTQSYWPQPFPDFV